MRLNGKPSWEARVDFFWLDIYSDLLLWSALCLCFMLQYHEMKRNMWKEFHISPCYGIPRQPKLTLSQQVSPSRELARVNDSSERLAGSDCKRKAMSGRRESGRLVNGPKQLINGTKTEVTISKPYKQTLCYRWLQSKKLGQHPSPESTPVKRCRSEVGCISKQTHRSHQRNTVVHHTAKNTNAPERFAATTLRSSAAITEKNFRP